MKLYEYYALNFENVGLIKPVKNPHDGTNIVSGKPCHFNRVCTSKETILCISSRSGELFGVCPTCAQSHFVSCIQRDDRTIRYYYYASQVDLNSEVVGKYKHDNLTLICGKKVRWLATSECGVVIGFTRKPKIKYGHWMVGERFTSAEQKNVAAYRGDWKESLERVF